MPLEVLRISTVVDVAVEIEARVPLEVLRISTVVDRMHSELSTVLWKY